MPSSLLSANPHFLPSNLSPRIHQPNSIRRTNQNPFQIPKGLLRFSVSYGNPCSNCRIGTSRFTRFCSTRGEKSLDVDVKTNRESEMEIGDDGVESRLKVEVGVPNFPVYLRWSKMSLGDQAFFLLAFVACTTSIAFTCLVVAAVPTLYAMRRAAISLSKLADTAREELPSTMAAIRLSGMEISDLTLELSDLSQEIADGVNKSVRAVQAAEAGIQQIGILAQRQTILKNLLRCKALEQHPVHDNYGLRSTNYVAKGLGPNRSMQAHGKTVHSSGKGAHTRKKKAHTSGKGSPHMREEVAYPEFEP